MKNVQNHENIFYMNYFVQEFSKVKFPRINKHKIKFKYMSI